MVDEIWRLPKVLAITGMGKSWLYAAVADGRFPAPVALGVRAIGWRRSVIEAWLEDRKPKGGRDGI